MLARSIAPRLAAVAGLGKMCFLSGPRQVGKTTLARRFQKSFGQSLYFNWDLVTDQKRLLKDPYFFESQDRDPAKPFLVVFDEIHKYARWKNYLKGAFDGFGRDFRFLVTGSGRLDLFKKGGDSLLGRYLSVPLFPLTVGELSGGLPSWSDFKAGLHEAPRAAAADREAYERLLRLSGFPEPFARGDARFYRSWFQDRKSALIRGDIRDATNIRDISLMELLSHLIPEKVGAPLSINALKESVGVAFETARDWILQLEAFYYMFRVPPFAGSLSRALRKEPKAYLYDWMEAPQEGSRFENLVALHLLKAVQTWRSLGEGDLGLHYVRDKEKREADFLLTEGRRPVCLVECKLTDTDLSPSLTRFQELLKVPVAVQLVHAPGVCRKTTRPGAVRWVISAERWLRGLP